MKVTVLLVLISSFIATANVRSLYERLDPYSIREHLAFYKLYKDTEFGKKALQDAWFLISQDATELPDLQFPENIDTFIALIEPSQKSNSRADINEEALLSIEKLAHFLPNRKLKGYHIATLSELDQLPTEQVDLAHGLFLLQFGVSIEAKKTRRIYEATLDLMALQVLAKIGPSARVQDKVQALNQLVFFDMGFRFPPQSSYSPTIDQFTFLPSVIESRRGVCLGVSTLYLALAQRLNLPLQIYTPPGHIFLSTGEINIETTHRGVHIPMEEYLNIQTKELKQRTMKEVLGMVYMNLASTYLSNSQFDKAAKAYEIAIRYMPTDPLIKQFLAFSYLFTGKEKEARQLLQEAVSTKDATTISPDSTAQDILDKKVPKEGLLPIFQHLDETRASFEIRKQALEKIVKTYPKFRTGLFYLAQTCIALRKFDEAIAVLEKLHAVDPNDIACEYYLTLLHIERCNLPKAVEHFQQIENIASLHNMRPRQLKELKLQLAFAR